MRPLALVLVLAIAASAHAQPAPTKYRVTLRYYIPAPRDPHVAQYDSMIKHLQGLNFEFDPPLEKHPDTDREDRAKNYLHGFIDAKNALKILDHRVIQTIQLVPVAPDEFKLPEEPDTPVTVRLELAGRLSADRQRELANQTRVLLRELGFKEPPGYDHRGYSGRIYTRLVGTIPRGKLDLLLRDLRNHPAGWFGPIIPREEMPTPLREVNPVTVVEVLPDTAPIKELTDPAPRTPEYLEKISPDLWELVKAKEVPTTPIRVQIAFAGAMTADDQGWKITLEEVVPGFFVEGQLGHFVTGIIRLDQVKTLASSPLVSLIRLPRLPHVDVDPAIKIKGDNKRALEQSGLRELHERGYRGKGVRVAVIDRDFRNWQKLVKSGQLPPKTRLVDVTAELDPDIYPLPYRGDPDAPGHGTLVAQAVALAAPDAEIVLVRIDVGDPHQLADILSHIRGNRGKFSTLIEQRAGELLALAVRLQGRRADLARERDLILNDFTDETDLKEYLGFLGPFYGWIYSDREWHRERMAYHEKLEAEHRLREQRLRDLIAEIRTLEGIPIVVNSLTWNSGYPLGAVSPLSKLLDDPKGPLWFQSVGNTRGQAWQSLFRSIPGDPALKFTDDLKPLPMGRRSNDVNFLGWSPYQGDAKPDLPEKTRVRITMQWREPHDPDYYLSAGDEDHYRKPLANLKLQLIRQRDPEGKALPPDAFDLVKRTAGWPERIEHLPSSSVYEHVLETTLDKAGRYAIRVERQPNSAWFFAPHPVRRTPTFQYVEGLAPIGIRPLGVPVLPALIKHWELRPRIFVEVIDDTNRVQGRAVFVDYATEQGAIALPADARNVISVGAATLANRPQPYSAFGSPAGMELAARPWLYSYDELELAGGGAFGASIANAFAAGTTAAMLSGRLTRDDVVQMLRGQEGQVLRVPFAKKQ